MNRTSIIIFLCILLGGTLGAGIATLYAIATNTPNLLSDLITPPPTPVECVVLGLEVHAAVEYVIIPGTDDSIPITGHLNTYRRLDCSGTELLVRNP